VQDLHLGDLQRCKNCRRNEKQDLAGDLQSLRPIMWIPLISVSCLTELQTAHGGASGRQGGNRVVFWNHFSSGEHGWTRPSAILIEWVPQRISCVAGVTRTMVIPVLA